MLANVDVHPMVLLRVRWMWQLYVLVWNANPFFPPKIDAVNLNLRPFKYSPNTLPLRVQDATLFLQNATDAPTAASKVTIRA